MELPVPFGTVFHIGFAGEGIALPCRKALYLVCSAAKSVLKLTPGRAQRGMLWRLGF